MELNIVQKDIEANSGGNVMIEAAKKIWHITTEIQEVEPIEETPKTTPKPITPPKIIPEEIELRIVTGKQSHCPDLR